MHTIQCWHVHFLMRSSLPCACRGVVWLQYQYDAHQDSRARQKFIFHQPLHHDVVNETSKHLQNKRCGSVLHCTVPEPRLRGGQEQGKTA